MIFDIIRNGFSLEVLVSLMARVFVIFCVMPIHEFAHAFVAYKLGDDTARLSGRLTLNPLAHVDLVGALMIFLVGFGYAKPVPVNPRNFKNPKGGMAATALAGPISNLIMAFIFLLPYCAVGSLYDGNSELVFAIAAFFFYAASVNIGLAVFNLIPIPPLDGSSIIVPFLKGKALANYYRLQQYAMPILIIVLYLLPMWTGIDVIGRYFDVTVYPLAEWLLNFAIAGI